MVFGLNLRQAYVRNVHSVNDMQCASLAPTLPLPVSSFYEPSYESGKAVRWEIANAEGEPLGIAGIWEHKGDGPNGLPLLSFNMLTLHADDHPLSSVSVG